MQSPPLARPWGIMVLLETALVEVALVKEYLYKIFYHFFWSFLRSQCGWEDHLVTLNFPDFKNPAVQFDQIKLVFLVKNSTTEKDKIMCKFFKYSSSTYFFLWFFRAKQPLWWVWLPCTALWSFLQISDQKLLHKFSL